MHLKNLLFAFTIIYSVHTTYNQRGLASGPLFVNNTDTMEFGHMDFCKLFGISKFNCTCEKNPAVCKATLFVSKVNTNTTITRAFQRWHGVTVIYATIAVTSSLFGIIGNLAVIAMAYRQRSQISPCKLHIAELAVVNFIFSAVQIVNVLPLYWTNTWIYGSVMCTVLKAMLEMGSLLSSGFFQLIAVERYFLIVYAMNVAKVKRFAESLKHVLFGANLILVIVTIIPYIYGLSIEPSTGRCVNFHGKPGWFGLTYNMFAVVVYSFVPILVTSFLAIKLIIHFALEAEKDVLVSREDVNKRIMMNMLLVLSLFIISTLPSRLVTITMDMATFKSHNVLLGFQFLSYTLYSLQGTLNPILYSMLAKEWRKNLGQMLRRLFGGNATMLKLKTTLRSSEITQNHEYQAEDEN